MYKNCWENLFSMGLKWELLAISGKKLGLEDKEEMAQGRMPGCLEPSVALGQGHKEC